MLERNNTSIITDKHAHLNFDRLHDSADALDISDAVTKMDNIRTVVKEASVT